MMPRLVSADKKPVKILRRQGAEAWNEWRKANPSVLPDLAGADLKGADLTKANLSETVLRGADLSGATMEKTDLGSADLAKADLASALFVDANLDDADLGGADLTKAHFWTSDLIGADLQGANLYVASFYECDLSEANLSEAFLVATSLMNVNLRGADLSGSNMTGASMVEADVADAEFTGSRVYGLSAWGLTGTPRGQSDLTITPVDEQAVTVDNLEVAQFVHLLINNPKIRDVINTIGRRGVLVLGRFEERKHVLEAIRGEVRRHGLVPIVFDFERPEQRDFSETVLTLAGMSRFIIADITKPKSVPLELQLAVPNYMIPFVPIVESPEKPFAMFQDLWKKHGDWVLEPMRYDSVEQLVQAFEDGILDRANECRARLLAKKTDEPASPHATEFIKR